ncbi:MAG: nuclear transport factor 2 family protein [Acidimicrobiia bacterium]|nr:nuclear transport factor 2 family protein [Acidimicrobiia bacterium]
MNTSPTPTPGATGGPPEPSSRAVVERYFAAVNAGDFDALRQVLHPEIELTACMSRPRQGIESVVAFFDAVFGRYPEHSDIPTRLICDGEVVVAEIHFEGRSDTGAEIVFEAVDVFDVVDGRIRRLSQWFDSADLRRQLRSPAPA